MFGEWLTHPGGMKQPGAERRHPRLMKIEMQKGAGFRSRVLREQIDQFTPAKMMKNAGRDIDRRSFIKLKGVGNSELARKPLCPAPVVGLRPPEQGCNPHQ